MNPVPFQIRLHIWLQRLVRWEFWAWRVVYLPVAVYWFFLAIKARAWVFFSAANPCMRFGGLVAYSKTDVTKLVPDRYLPNTIFIESNSAFEDISKQLVQKKMTFPLIIKPDMGERGRGVKIILTEVELIQAISAADEKMLLQVYENLPLELGILYSRHPSEPVGKITSVVIKDFPVVIGDGKSTLLQLILANLRTRLSYKVHLRTFADRLSEIPAMGEKIQIVKIGNHMLGTTFTNGNHLISEDFEAVFDNLSKQIAGFYIGRFDIRTESMEELKKGNFKVIEVNGVNSEPCHIYDPKTPLWLGLRDLFAQWTRIYEISIANHKLGAPYDSYSEIRREIRRHNGEVAKHV
ncbi:MAG: hypothetical protein ACJAYA_000121 [Bacteroidia bacterium]|jgi:hypothetical protein